MTDLKREASVCSAGSRSEEPGKQRDPPPMTYCLAHLRFIREAWQRERVSHRKKTAASRFLYAQALLSSQEIPRERKIVEASVAW